MLFIDLSADILPCCTRFNHIVCTVISVWYGCLCSNRAPLISFLGSAIDTHGIDNRFLLSYASVRYVHVQSEDFDAINLMPLLMLPID